MLLFLRLFSPTDSKLSDDALGSSEQSVILSRGRHIKANSEAQRDNSVYANTQLTRTKKVSMFCVSKAFAIQIAVSLDIMELIFFWSSL